MIEKFKQHISEVHAHYQSGDNDLGLRRLLDSVIETQDPEVFKISLEFCDWLEKQKPDQEMLISHAGEMLETIKRVGIKKAYQGPETVLEMEGLSKSYHGSGFRIHNISFSMMLGQITGLVGENGNGKTTLLRLLASELRADNGTLKYHLEKKNPDAYDIKTQLIYIEQRIPRWFGKLTDNLQFTVAHYHDNPKANHLWTEVMIARMGLRAFRNHTWSRISSGYRTRFELARTLLRRPRILLLDEPLANLDIVAQQTILQDLKYMSNSLSSPFSMILSSQHIYEVEKVSDAIVFIQNGEARYESIKEQSKTDGDTGLILEMEINAERSQLQEALIGVGLTHLQYNGGVYMLHFEQGTHSSEVLRALSEKGLETLYFRNISRSSRRYFIQ
ncbi:MAG: ATP-binding cassette domain-containing protein [Bacteroidetes bacterium]|nr:ATP-binding cassette domain-containing protein [Bacteroidota bacterium]